MVDERTPEHVRLALTRFGLAIRTLDADTSTSALAADALGTSVGSIAKSLLFFADDRPILVVASGDTRVDGDRLAHIVGAPSVRLARPREVLAVTGYRVGGVPPLAHATPVRVLMDRRLTAYPIVYAAAGSPAAIFPVEPGRLLTIARAELVDVAVPAGASGPG